jgi:tetratricopeptide (TPR) repeat protein
LADLQSIPYLTVDLAATHTARGIVSTAENDYENAMRHLEAAENILVMKAPRSVEFAKLCMAMGDVLLEQQQDPENALGRYQLAKSIYHMHHITNSSQNPILDSIEKTIEQLAWTVAEHNERQSGIPTAVARMVPATVAEVSPPIPTRRTSMSQVIPVANDAATVIALPMEDGCSCLSSEFPLAETMRFEDYENL